MSAKRDEYIDADTKGPKTDLDSHELSKALKKDKEELDPSSEKNAPQFTVDTEKANFPVGIHDNDDKGIEKIL